MSAATKIIEEMISSEIQKGKFFVFGEAAYVELDSVISALPKRNSVKKNCIEVPGFGEIVWPLKNFGNLDSYCFFSGLKFCLWCSYLESSAVSAWDVGAHSGIDTILMSKKFKNIDSFEPQPYSFKDLQNNLGLNTVSQARLHNVGLSTSDGTGEFEIVHGNTTASHLAGSRTSYGPKQKILIELSNHWHYKTPEFAKMNIEGYETQLIPSLGERLLEMDLIVESHDSTSSDSIYQTARKIDIKLYSHKIGFDQVKSRKDMPESNKEGYIILSAKNRNNWFEFWNGI